jgi:hypothetical protein
MPIATRELVVWLNAKGFIAESIRGEPGPMVMISARREHLLDQADMLVKYLSSRGVKFSTLKELGTPHVQAVYIPGRPIGDILLFDVTSADAGL